MKINTGFQITMASATHYKNMFLTAGGTLGSRILGLVRDQLIVGFLGSGAIASAVFFALLIPNLFRRLLGEGALTAALVPVMSDELKLGGKKRAFQFLNLVLTRAALLMLGITGVAMAVAFFISRQIFLEERYQFAAKLTVICMPYMPLICLTALFTAGLNIFGRFGVTALSAIWLNLAMIGAICGAGFFFADNEIQLAAWVCFGSLAGGILQLAIPMIAFARDGWRPRATLEKSEAWTQLKKIFLPAVAGAGIQQINFFVSRFLALNVDDQSLTVYYLANRIVELPIGVFAITVSTVIFPVLAGHAANGNFVEMGRSFAHGLRLILCINIPATIGLIVLSSPIVQVLFQHGKFSANDTAAMLPVLWIFAIAMPFYGVISLLGRALNARKDTRTQAKIAGQVFLLNLLLSPVFAWLWGAAGLAFANLISAVFQCAILWRVLRKNDTAFFAEKLSTPFLQCLAASVLMGIVAFLGREFLAGILPEKTGGVISLALLIPICATLYFLMLAAARFPEIKFFREKIFGKNRK